MRCPPWYVPGNVGSTQLPLNASHAFESPIPMNDFHGCQGRMVIPAYISPGYTYAPTSTMQQNNAVPLLPVGRSGNNVESSKPLTYIPTLQQPPLSHSFGLQPNYGYSNLNPNAHIRSHPYSFVKRSSSTSGRRHSGTTSVAQTIGQHPNNHTTTEASQLCSTTVEHKSKRFSTPRESSECFSPGGTKTNTVGEISTPPQVPDTITESFPKSAVDASTDLNAPDRVMPETTSPTEVCAGKMPRFDVHRESDDRMGDRPLYDCLPYHPSGFPSSSSQLTAVVSSQQLPHVGSACDISGIGTYTTSPPMVASKVNPPDAVVPGELSREGHQLTSNASSSAVASPASQLCVTTEGQLVLPGSSSASAANKPPRSPPSVVLPAVLGGNSPAAAGAHSSCGAPLVAPSAPAATALSFIPAPGNPAATGGLQQPFLRTTAGSAAAATCFIASAPISSPAAFYLESLSLCIWQFYTSTRQSRTKYAKKVHLRNALHVLVSGVFENAGLFIVGSSMNGFGSDVSDMDMCLTVTSRELQQKKEAFVVLSQLMPPLRKCSFIQNLHLIRAKVPILKFRDTLTGVDCDLNVNNVVGIYNTYLLAMYTRIDWRVRPLGMFIKHWAQRMDIHGASRGRLSTYPLLLMLIHYLQCSCSPPILPNLQAKFPKLFNYTRPLCELDMRLELPWAELRSSNPASLAELFIGFIHHYANEFDFSRWAVSVRNGAPLSIDMAIRRLPPHEQAQTARSFKWFIEEPFCQSNAARSLYDDGILARIRQAFVRTHQTLRSHRSLDSIWVNASTDVV